MKPIGRKFPFSLSIELIYHIGNTMLEAYNATVAERAALGIPALPLTKDQTAELVKLLKNPPAGKEAELVELITLRVPAGVDEAAKVKAEFLDTVAKGTEKSPLISRVKATELLGTMLGGYNIKPLVELLSDAECGTAAAAPHSGSFSSSTNGLML